MPKAPKKPQPTTFTAWGIQIEKGTHRLRMNGDVPAYWPSKAKAQAASKLLKGTGAIERTARVCRVVMSFEARDV